MGKYRKEAEEASKETDNKHFQKIQQLSGVDEPTLNKFFPEPVDQQKLAKLIDIVNSSTTENEKINKLKENITEIADTITRLVKIIKPV